MAKKRAIGPELIEAMEEALAYTKGKRTGHRVYTFDADDVRMVRVGLKMSQAEFARTFHLGLKTLQKWERGERRPTGPAATLLQVIRRDPKAVKRALSDDAEAA
ncbi:MAG TPA: NadS family protein [Dongiaceae bacterium]|nr:NadS family protein [Dongiaceae bacterium]